MKINVHIHRDEWYPVYVLEGRNWGPQITVTPKFLEEYTATFKKFVALQKKLSTRFHKVVKG